jgi:hypothetical protein
MKVRPTRRDSAAMEKARDNVPRQWAHERREGVA